MKESVEEMFQKEIVELLLENNEALQELVALTIQMGIYPMVDSNGEFIGYNIHSDDIPVLIIDDKINTLISSDVKTEKQGGK